MIYSLLQGMHFDSSRTTYLLAVMTAISSRLVLLFALCTFIALDCLHQKGYIKKSRGQSSSSYTRTSDLSSRANPQTDSLLQDSDISREIWWENGLKFGCTACGRCCQNEGEVWLDDDEFADLALYLQESPLAVLDRYSENLISGWVKMKSNLSDDPKLSNRCIFLGTDGKQCSIYEARPIQCRTYPFWPRLLSTPENWQEEAVIAESWSQQESVITLLQSESEFVNKELSISSGVGADSKVLDKR